MQSRTSHSHVTFRRPFQLAGMDSPAPAGRYRVDLEEERLDSLTVEVWRQTAVTLEVIAGGTTEYWRVDSSDLRDALLRDGADDTDSAAPVAAARRRKVLTLRQA